MAGQNYAAEFVGKFSMEGNGLQFLKQLTGSMSSVNQSAKQTANAIKQINSTNIKRLKNETKEATSAFKKLNSSIKTVRKNVFGVGVAFSASVFAINKMVSSSGEMAFQIDAMSNAAGITAGKFQLMSNHYSNVAGISLGKAQGEIASLGEKIEQVKLGLADPMPFIMAGVNINQGSSADTVIADMQKRFNNMDSQRLGVMMKTLGLSKEFVYLIKSSEEDMLRISQIPVLSKEQINDLKEMNKSFDLIKKQMSGMKNEAMAKIAPVLNKEFLKLFDLINKNKDKIIDFLTKLVKFMSDFAIAVGNAAEFVGNMMSSILGLDNSITGLAIAMGILLLAMSPLTAMIALFVLLADDFMVWKRGGDSLFGSIYEWINKIYSLLSGNDITSTFARWTAGIVGVFGAFKIASMGISGMITSITGLMLRGTVLALRQIAALMLTPPGMIMAGVAVAGYGLYKGYQHFFGDKKQGNEGSESNAMLPKGVQSTQMTPIANSFFSNKSNNNTNSDKSVAVQNTYNVNITGEDGGDVLDKLKKYFAEQQQENQDAYVNKDFNFEGSYS